jgi:hypothetical protein
MAWRTIGSNRYYQKTYRDVDGRSRTRYFGCGPLAEAVARLDARRREHRAEISAERERLAATERRIVEYCEGIDELSAAWMRLKGWHRHHGQWRPNGKITRRNMITSKGLDRLVEAEKVRREFEVGNVVELIQRYGGDMATRTVEVIIASITDDAREQEALRRQAARIRDRHAGPNPTDIELALAERIAVAYMDVYYSDQLAYGDDDEFDVIDGGITIREAEYHERRRERADRRYMAAIDALDRVKRLNAPVVRPTAERFGLVV